MQRPHAAEIERKWLIENAPSLKVMAEYCEKILDVWQYYFPKTKDNPNNIFLSIRGKESPHLQLHSNGRILEHLIPDEHYKPFIEQIGSWDKYQDTSGYLKINGELDARMRTKQVIGSDHIDYLITLKAKANEDSRFELEFPVSREFALAFKNQCLCGLHKKRAVIKPELVSLSAMGEQLELVFDYFLETLSNKVGNTGLVMAEAEILQPSTKSALENISKNLADIFKITRVIPSLVAKNADGDKNYSNRGLAEISMHERKARASKDLKKSATTPNHFFR